MRYDKFNSLKYNIKCQYKNLIIKTNLEFPI